MGFDGYVDYKVILEEVSSSVERKISGDTLFGKFSWVFREFYGNEKLTSLLNEHCIEPIIIFSGIFPKEYLPMPLYLPALSEFQADEENDYDTFKRIKKEKYVNIRHLNNLLSKNGELAEILNKSVEPSSFYRVQVAISRKSGSALEGMIYTTTEVRYGMDLWVFIRLREGFFKNEEISEIINVMFETGIGAKKSSGKGIYRVKGFEKTDLLTPKGNENAFLSLNRWVPREKDPSDGFYRIYSKRARLGGTYSEAGFFQKHPILMIEEGSIFFLKEPKPYYGRVIQNVQLPIYEIKENIVQSCYCLPFYLNISSEGD